MANKLDDPVKVFTLPFIFLKSGERSRRLFGRQIPRKGSESGCIVWRHDRVWIAGNHMRSVQNPWPHERVTGEGIIASELLFFADDEKGKWCPKQSFVPPRCLRLEPRTCEVFTFQVLCAGLGYRTRERFRRPQAFWSRKAHTLIWHDWDASSALCSVDVGLRRYVRVLSPRLIWISIWCFSGFKFKLTFFG